MKSRVKLPLYLGLSVLVFSVIMSAIKIGSRGDFTSQRTKASSDMAILTLKFTQPDIVSLILTSEKEIKGIDAVLQYNKDQITILPSSLKAGANFVTTGGIADDKTGTFSFSGISTKPSVSTGIVASFTVSPKGDRKSAEGSIQFGQGQLSSSVIDNITGLNILGETQGVKFTLSTK